MGAWICPTCRQHYGDEVRRRCPADGAGLVLNLSGASVQGHILTHLLHVSPDGSTLWEASSAADERVALELLRGPQDTVAWARAQALSHPRIVEIKAYAAIDDDLACVVMSWLDGVPLGDLLVDAPLPPPRALAIVDQLLEALEYAHAQGVVHGDLNPSVIFVGAEDAVRLLDVGVRRWPPLAELLGARGGQALESHMIAYAPPERLALGEVEPASDLYAIGALLWHLLTGEPPFGTDPHLVARSHLTAPRPSLEAARPDLRWPEGLDDLVRTAMASRPEARFASAGAMRVALVPVLEAAEKTPTLPPVVVEPAAPTATIPAMSAPPMPVMSSAPPPAPVVALQPPAPDAGVTTLMWVAGVGLAVIGLILLIRSIDSRPEVHVLPNESTTIGAVATEPAVEPVEPIERVKATPITAAPATRAPTSVASVLSVASEAPPTAIASVAPVTAPVAPISAVASIAPVTDAAPATEVAVQVPSEPPAPKAAPPSKAPTEVERPVDVRRIAQPTRRPPSRKSPPRRKITKRPPVARVEQPATAAAPRRIEPLGKPTREAPREEPRVKVLGE